MCFLPIRLHFIRLPIGIMLKGRILDNLSADYNFTYTIEFLCAGTDAATRFALAAGNWWTVEVHPTTFAQCRVLTTGQDTRAVALYANNKRTRVTSKLALWFFYHSRTALVVRDYCGCLPMYARIPPST